MFKELFTALLTVLVVGEAYSQKPLRNTNNGVLFFVVTLARA